MDIVGSLPPEVSIEIFRYLSGIDLLRCEVVCKKWKEYLEVESLWKTVCFDEFPQEIPENCGDGLHYWKDLCSRAARSITNWGNHNYKTLIVENASSVTDLGNGAVLAILFNDGSISLYDVNTSLDPVQYLEPYLEFDSSYYWYETGSGRDMLVVHIFLPEETNGIFVCYKYNNGRLEYYKTLRSPDESSIHKIVRDTIVVLAEDIQTTRTYLHFFPDDWPSWRTETTGLIAWIVYEDRVYVLNAIGITVYTIEGEVETFLECDFVSEVSTLHVNRRLLVLESRWTADDCTVQVYDKKTWRKLCARQLHCRLLVLHPRLAKVVQDRRTVVLVTDLITGRDVHLQQEAPRLSPFSFWYSFVGNKYVFCSTISHRDPSLVFDLDTGRLVFSIETSDGHVRTANDKILVVTGEGNRKMLIMSFA